MNNQISIPCPDCQTSIFFDPHMLITGARFACPKCAATIGLAAESTEVVKESLDKFSKIKNEILKTREDNSQF